MIYYDRCYPVKKWIIFNGLNEKQQELVKKTMPKDTAVFCPWPAIDMYAELKKLAAEGGYWEYLNQPMPFFLEMTFALRAVVNLTRSYNKNAQISPKPPYHRMCNNRIEQDADFVKLCNDILKANDEVTLSQVFDTAERTDKIWVSFNAEPEVITKIAKRIEVRGEELVNLNNKDFLIAVSAAFRE